MATHSSILVWRIPWREEPGRLQSMGPQRVGHDWATSLTNNMLVLKFLQARLQQYMNQELPDVQARFGKGKGTRNQIASTNWIIKKKHENSRKTSTSTSLTTLKLLTVWITTNCGKFFKRWEYQTTSPAS